MVLTQNRFKKKLEFLAVQDSSINALFVCLGQLTIFTLQSLQSLQSLQPLQSLQSLQLIQSLHRQFVICDMYHTYFLVTVIVNSNVSIKSEELKKQAQKLVQVDALDLSL